MSRYGIDLDVMEDEEAMAKFDETNEEHLEEDDFSAMMEDDIESLKQGLLEESSDDSLLLSERRATTLHDYIGHPIQQVCILFYNNKIPEITRSIQPKQPSELATELILAISLRNTIRFYSLLYNQKEMRLQEISDNSNNTKVLTLDHNIKFMKVLNDVLIVCDEKATIHVFKFKIDPLDSDEGDSTISIKAEHEVKIYCSIKPYTVKEFPEKCEILSFDAVASIEGQDSKIGFALGTSNGLLYSATFECSSLDNNSLQSPKNVVKFQHKSMLPILSVSFPIRQMVTMDIPLTIYYQTLNCLYSIDINQRDSKKAMESTLVLTSKERITYFCVHPHQPNHLILGLSNGHVVSKDQVNRWEKEVSNHSIKFVEFNSQKNAIFTGDEHGSVHYVDIRSSQPGQETTIPLIDNLDGNDIKIIHYLCEDQLLVVNANGRINLIV